MAGLVPAIHAPPRRKTWVPRTSPGMTPERVVHPCLHNVIASAAKQSKIFPQTHFRIASSQVLLAMAETVVTIVRHGISYTTILSAMPRSAACFWIGLISRCLRTSATAGASSTGPVMWISCAVERLCTRAAMLTV
jgi:hypothetical protein